MGSFRLSWVGRIVAALFVLAVVSAVFGSRTEQIVGITAAVLLLVFAVGGVPLNRGAAGAFTSTNRGRAVAPPEPEALDEAPADPQAWQRERERREAAGREP